MSDHLNLAADLLAAEFIPGLISVRAASLCHVLSVRTASLCHLLSVRTASLCHLLSVRTASHCHLLSVKTASHCHLLSVKMASHCHLLFSVSSAGFCGHRKRVTSARDVDQSAYSARTPPATEPMAVARHL
jgi:hypothetical protein